MSSTKRAHFLFEVYHVVSDVYPNHTHCHRDGGWCGSHIHRRLDDTDYEDGQGMAVS
jgi:hypothetical protein